MDEQTLHSRLSRISTNWTALAKAHRVADQEADAARLEFILRYQSAAYRYLLGAVRDLDTADDLFQEFALRFMRRDFQRATPEKGRFRDYLKTTLYHLVSDHFARRRKRGASLDDDVAEAEHRSWERADSDAQFASSWRAELLARAWSTLAGEQQAGGPPYYAVLKFRTEHPKTGSADMAKRLSDQLQRSPPFTESGIRKTLQRARVRFADLLLDDVAFSLNDPSLEKLEEELIDLRLLEYCRSALQRRRTAT